MLASQPACENPGFAETPQRVRPSRDAATRALPNAYRLQVERYLRRRMAASPDVEDLAQEICLRYLAAPCNPENPLGYLRGVMKNSLADYYHQKARERRLFVEMPEDSALVPESCVTEDASRSIDTARQVESLLAKLPCSQRLVLIEHERYGYSYQEVAERLGYTVQTVEKYLVIAKATLRALARSKRAAT